MNTITCPKCGYTWTPRTDKPKACPECKIRIQRLLKKEEAKAEGREAL